MGFILISNGSPNVPSTSHPVISNMLRHRQVQPDNFRVVSPAPSASLTQEGLPVRKDFFRHHMKWVTRKLRRWFRFFRFPRSRSQSRSKSRSSPRPRFSDPQYISPYPYIATIPGRPRTPPPPPTPPTPGLALTRSDTIVRRVSYESDSVEGWELEQMDWPEPPTPRTPQTLNDTNPLYHARTTNIRDESLYEEQATPKSRWSFSTIDTRSLRSLLVGDFKLWNFLDETKTVFPFHESHKTKIP